MRESNALKRITRNWSQSLSPIPANQNIEVRLTQEEIRFKTFSLINVKNHCNEMWITIKDKDEILLRLNNIDNQFTFKKRVEEILSAKDAREIRKIMNVNHTPKA